MLSDNVKNIQEKVKKAAKEAHRLPEDVTILAVTKYVTADVALELVHLGMKNLAENRSELLLEKKQALANEDITWHLIGNLQRRKVKNVINEIDYFHALDSFRLATEINKRAEKVINCFVEVNISKEVTKHGFAIGEVQDFIHSLKEFENIRIVGLMTMAPYDATDDELHLYFSTLKQLQVEIAELKLAHAPCTELSMGMSKDFPIAIMEGATFVRIGTAFFQDISKEGN
ncbi:MAG: YggS family pyridoxal phosphate-dependent enzyme [Lactobacillales bacterium]|jgi:pyridoxal phosphate enzyme (YggS family)|nr:YggS family pyridoxal phosphate-dependent enzyme [Lactobacillales bacterium]